jgi:lysylphosphatidylglycerol synthetase-like protein (DUF2156 family)
MTQHKLLYYLGALLGLSVFSVVLQVLHRELRQYKEKFDPEWEPKYLASPGGLALPRILTNIASLISGGLKGVIAK